MFVSKEFRFEASHILPRHKGKCSQLHGHSWRMVVEVHGPIDPDTQFVLDFAELKKMVQPLVDLFDHKHLNCFITYPSSENVATYVAHELLGKMDKYRVSGYTVRVSETEPTWAVWSSADPLDRERFTGIRDGEWKAPTIVGIVDVYKSLNLAVEESEDAWEEWQRQQTLVEQLKLYMATMDFKPELPTKG